MKKIRKIIAFLYVLIFLTVHDLNVYANPCAAPYCGCGARGIAVCYAGMTCWYTDYDGCMGHNWYLYEVTGATCTDGGRIVYRCSICPGERVFGISPLGHDWGPWTCLNSSQHMRRCRRCNITQTEYHSMSGWNSNGGGYYSRNCSRCDYSENKGLFLSVSTSDWTSGFVTVNVTGFDESAGNSDITLYMVNCITGATTCVGTFDHGGAHGWTSDTFTQTEEGIYSFYAISTDAAGHSIRESTGRIYLDHSDPVIIGAENTESDWTNVAPVISIRSTDFLYGTVTEGSGVRSVTIYDEDGETVASGGSQTSYVLEDRFEGEHVFRIEAVDRVGNRSETFVTTRYDITPPHLEGTETTYITDEGEVISGYCQDNVISQHADDNIRWSENSANASSGIRSIILYRVTGTDEEAIYSDTTYKRFDYPDTDSFFDVYYDIALNDDRADYYILIVEDFAGNRLKKKLTSQRALLTLFHTSIERESY